MSEGLPAVAPWKKYWHSQRSLRYVGVGLWNTAIGYGLFALCYTLLSPQFNYLLIAILSHMMGVSQAFITHRRWVFRSQGPWLHEYLRYHLAHLGALGFGLITLPLLVELAALEPLTAQALIVVVTVIGSYFVHRHFTFRTHDD